MGGPLSAALIEMERARARLAPPWLALHSPVSEAVQTNLELARQTYELWNASEVDALRKRFWAPDIVFYDLPEAPDTGIFRGAEEFAARIRAVTESWDHLPKLRFARSRDAATTHWRPLTCASKAKTAA